MTKKWILLRSVFLPLVLLPCSIAASVVLTTMVNDSPYDVSLQGRVAKKGAEAIKEKIVVKAGETKTFADSFIIPEGKGSKPSDFMRIWWADAGKKIDWFNWCYYFDNGDNTITAEHYEGIAHPGRRSKKHMSAQDVLKNVSADSQVVITINRHGEGVWALLGSDQKTREKKGSL